MSSSNIFERLPLDIFNPLASENKVRYWEMLLRLADRFFGPEAVPPEGDGFLQRVITAEIERFLADTADWTPEEGGEPAATPLSIQASMAYRYLVRCGWLKEDRIGVRNFVVMPTAVLKFLEVVKQFSEEGPQILGGKVQLIHNQLREVVRDPVQQAGGFHEAALQARQLIAVLGATTMRVKEAMELLSSQDTTAAFVRSFFDDYIGRFYIQDYHELRTENHPLRHRIEIINLALQLRDYPRARRVMTNYYRSALRCVDDTSAEEAFEKDISAFLAFKDIEAHINRLNASVDRATARAISYLQYKLRTQGQLDRLITLSLSRLAQCRANDTVSAGLLSGTLIGESRLPTMAKRAARPTRTVITSKSMTIEQKAQVRLKRAIKMSREVTLQQIREYLDGALAGGQVCHSDDLPILSIHDFCRFIVASRLAMASRVNAVASARLHPLLSGLREYRFIYQEGEFTDNDYLRVPRFTVSRIAHGASHANKLG